MSDSRAARLYALFDRAADLTGAARDQLLDAECQGDADLRAAVERLLAADQSPTAALFDLPLGDRQLRPGEVVAGRYRVIRQVGAGGMGVVFEAEQLEPRRRVALKCLRSGFVDPDLLQRFRREAQALGRLQHPGIAQVLEAGLTDGEPAIPFLAMEFVDGQHLTTFAAGLPVRAKLELLMAIADAVAHAHDRGVVHRDLKPSNILVETGSGGPRPRVLDFGVARFADGDSAVQTRTHQIVGTLAYLSPEQLTHGSATADPRSDVWSLGVTAYELLAGTLPLPLAGQSLAAAALILREREPEPLERQVPALRGDVATIVHKALAKDPARRYAHAGELAADLRRHLAAEPILARPASAYYVATRLVRRHRGLFTGLALAFVALGTGLVTALLYADRAAADRDRAERRTGELRGLVRTLVADLDQDLQQVPGTTAARQRLLQIGQQHAAAMAAEAAGDPGITLEVAALHEVLANVQGRPGSANLGDPAGALQSLDTAADLIETALRAHPRHLDLHEARRRLLRNRDSLLRALGRSDERLANLEALQRQTETLRTLAPGPASERAAAMTAADLGRLLGDLGRLDDAVQQLVRARDFFATAAATATAKDQRSDAQSLRILWQHLGMLHERRGDFATAREAFAAAVTLAAQAAAAEPGLTGDRDLANALRSQATFLVQRGDAAGALAALRAAAARIAPHAAQAPQDYDLQRLSAIVEFGIADALIKSGAIDEGLTQLRHYMRHLETMLETHRNPQLERDLIPGRQLLAIQLAKRQQHDEAAAVATACVELARTRVARAPAEGMALDDLLGSYGAAAFVHSQAMARTDIDAAATAAARARTLATLQAQLDLARDLEQRRLLEPRRRGLLTELPQSIDALRGPQ